MASDGKSTFDIVETAGFYSQLAGVLAGFAFAAIMVLLTARLTPVTSSTGTTARFNSATRLLVVSFIGLVLASLDYAVLAGDTSGKIRSVTLEIIAGVGFATAGLVLIYAMVLTFDDVDSIAQGGKADSVGSFLRGLLTTVLTPLILLFIYLSVQDFNHVAYETRRIRPVDVISWLLIGAQLVVGTSYHIRYRNTAVTVAARDRSIRTLARAAVVAVVSTSILFAIFSAFLDSGSRREPVETVPITAMVLSTIGSICFTRHLSRSRPH